MTLIKTINKNKITGFVFLQVVYLYYSIIGVLSKEISHYVFFSPEFVIGYIFMLAATFLYAILWQQALKKTTLVVAYANKGVVILWTLLWAVIFFKEHITVHNIVGSVMIILGIVLVIKDE